MTRSDGIVRRLTAMLATLTGFAMAVALLVASGRTLPFPARLGPPELVHWVGQAGAVTATFTTLRALAVALLGWLVATWTVAVAARLFHRPSAVRIVDRWSPPPVRRLADLAVGVTVVVAGLAPATLAGAVTTTISTSQLVPVAMMMRDLGPVTPAPTANPMAPPSVPAASAASAPSSAATTWLIRPGDTLWHVADASLTDELGRPPSASEVADRLERIVRLNRDRLAVPGDTDLVFPGQEFVLP